MSNICTICSKKCFGIDGYDGSCCTLENRDFIIGAHSDEREFLERLSQRLGRKIERHEVFIDEEEGKKLFPNKSSWQKSISYPALRVDMTNKRLPCIFYNTTLKYCTVYDIRPQTCKTFECDYLKNNKTL